ncbi:MAG: type I restriction endonuclease subunit R [Methanosphaera stadtmanae]|nr:type I restriction endonuclease subunit R [Methanosphaera stadtmanae]
MKTFKIDERNEFQKRFISELNIQHSYVIRNEKIHFDKSLAMDKELLLNFLESTQPNEINNLKKVYGMDYEETIINYINNEITKKGSSLIKVLKNGVIINHTHINLMYSKPVNTYNDNLNNLYSKNIFSVMEEVWASDTERVDLVIFLNGIAIISIELKSNASGQTYEDAIEQFRNDRNPKNRLFLFKSGCLIFFAMDFNEVHMTTKLNRKKTHFLPFNKGVGEGINCGSGNPNIIDDYNVSYMWNDILHPDNIIDLISDFIFVENKEEFDEISGKTQIKEKLIFPRYHQLDLLRKTVNDVKKNYTSQNYLIQHSAGSGKTYSIAWLAYKLASLHDVNNQIIYDNIIIITDRIAIDRQLQRAILNIEHQDGFVQVMHDDCTSHDLKLALERNTKIIVSTIQKFKYICNDIKEFKSKTFAVIIDEAHSSTTGSEMESLNQTLSNEKVLIDDAQDLINYELSKTGKNPNVSMFAFTATPKSTTLNTFGKLNKHGQREAFHIYSMKQAIEEGFILDVLQSYTPYKTYYELEKKIAEDPRYETREAQRQIARHIAFHETNINQRIEIIVEHFRNMIMNELGGKAKAMVVTSYREEAVRYKLAFEEYIKRKEYDDIKALVAFSGSITIEETGKEYTEVGINGFPEKKLPDKFDTDEYQVLLVANKYQTGFDQDKLCAMYVLKPLEGVNAVQTLSRLNRPCLPYDKRVFILDFIPDNYDKICKAFEKYYNFTILSNDITPDTIYNLVVRIDAFNILDPEDIDRVNEILVKEEIPPKDKQKINYCMNKTISLLSNYDIDKQKEFRILINNFLRFYTYLIQVTLQRDVELHKKYKFLSILKSYINIKKTGKGFDLSNEIYAHNFRQQKKKEIKSKKILSNPIISLPTADSFSPSEEVEKVLSEIILDHNKRVGKDMDVDSTTIVANLLVERLLASESLKKSAKNNKFDDFKHAYYKSIKEESLNSFKETGDIYSEFLNDENFLKEVMDIFISYVYNTLKKE